MATAKQLALRIKYAKTSLISLTKKLTAGKAKLKVLEADLKKANSELDYILGTFSGLSGSDVMAVMYALFTVDTEVLLSLLNDDALKRASKHFGQTTISTRIKSMEAAVTILENKVKEIIDTKIVPEFNETRHSNKKK